MGQRAAATGVKFRLGSPSTLSKKVASGLVWRFGTFNCVSDNLACFKDGFGQGIPLAKLKSSQLTFHGIVPGHSCAPLGRVQLEVLFGKKSNSRREPIWFEVVDISSPYHALLGRPALAKFMAVPHYAYLKMKLPGPRGVIMVSGCFKKSLVCAKASSQLAEALVIAEEKRQLLHRMERTQQDVPVRQSPVEQFKPANDTKKILLDESDPSKSSS
jgi:hypothetical protein